MAADEPSAASPDANRRMFDRIARRYDLLNRLLSLGLDGRWRRRTVAALDVRPGGRYLDVGCGTGDVMIALLGRCGSCRVVGADPSEGMLAVARERLARAGLAGRAELHAARAEALPFADASFDAAASAFCLRNVSDRPAALSELRRVLRPGGLLAVLELTVPTGRLRRLAHGLYAGLVAPLVGGLLAGDRAPYRYLVESIRAFGPTGRLPELLSGAGFVAGRHVPLTAGAVGLFVARRP